MKVLFCTDVRRKKDTNAIAFLAAMAIVFAVCLGVDLFMQGSPAAFLDPYFALAMVVFAVWAIYKYSSSKLQLEVTEDSPGILSVRIEDRNHGDQIVTMPFEMDTYYALISQGRGPRVQDTYLRLLDAKGECLLTLNHNFGALYDVPYGFPKIDDREHFRRPKNNIYTCAEIGDVYRHIQTVRLKQ